MNAIVVEGRYVYKILYSLRKDGVVKEWMLMCTIIDAVRYDKDNIVELLKFDQMYLLNSSSLEGRIYGCRWSVYRNGPNDKWQQSKNTIIKVGLGGRTVVEQLILDCNSEFNDKIKRGSSTDKDSLVKSIGVGPIYGMNQHIYQKYSGKIHVPAWICEKFNGDRVLIDIDPSGTSRVYSRMTTPCLGINFIGVECQLLGQVVKQRTIFDCEAYINTMPLNDITSTVTNGSNTQQVYLNCFDICIPSNRDLPFIQRYNQLCTLFDTMYTFITSNDVMSKIQPHVSGYSLFAINRAQFGHIKIVPYTLVNSHDEIEQQYRKFVETGAEGIVVRNLDGKYELSTSNVRSYDVLKYKPRRDADWRVVGFLEAGTGKCAGMIKFMCITKGGEKFKASVKGWSDDMRRTEYAKCKNIAGYFDLTYGNKYAKIEYSDVYPNGKPQQPYVIGFRNASDVVMTDLL